MMRFFHSFVICNHHHHHVSPLVVVRVRRGLYTQGRTECKESTDNGDFFCLLLSIWLPPPRMLAQVAHEIAVASGPHRVGLYQVRRDLVVILVAIPGPCRKEREESVVGKVVTAAAAAGDDGLVVAVPKVVALLLQQAVREEERNQMEPAAVTAKKNLDHP
mmetsp:Transcript_18635/g.43199  ORF Transcript_18635/g.43199 Transcript_18635/m.43199 type:complete len:161 (-) Transcript_18635:327-809(-)